MTACIHFTHRSPFCALFLMGGGGGDDPKLTHWSGVEHVQFQSKAHDGCNAPSGTSDDMSSLAHRSAALRLSGVKTCAKSKPWWGMMTGTYN